MLSQYNPFRVRSEEFVFKAIGDEEIMKGGIDTFHDSVVLMTKGSLTVIDRSGKSKGFPIKGPSTAFVRTTDNFFIVFKVWEQEFSILNISEGKIYEVKITNRSQWVECQYQLHYFNRSSLVALVEKNREKAKLKITYFAFTIEDGQPLLNEVSTSETHEDSWQSDQVLFEIDNISGLGWCDNFKNTLKLMAYQKDQGMVGYAINLDSLNDIFRDNEFKVLSMWQRDNLLFLAINPCNNSSISCDSSYSPILIINRESEGGLTASFSSCKFEQVYQFSIKECFNLEDYCIFFTDDEGDQSAYVYEKELQMIVKTFKKDASLKATAIYQNNSLLLYDFIEGSQLKVIEKSFSRVNSLSLQKALQLIERAQTIKGSVETAIIIFGGDKTGKSTLRQFLSGQKLINTYDEQTGFSVMMTQSNEMQGLEHEDQKERIPWMNNTQSVAIIDVPDWNQRDYFFKAQIQLLLARLFRIFSHFHFIITIPYEYVDDSNKNSDFFTSVLEIVSNEEGLEESMSIVLTKIDSAEESLQAFNERIQEIMEINEDAGAKIKSISEGNRILPFENREVTVEEGTQMLQTLLSFNKISLHSRESLPTEQSLKSPSDIIDLLFYELEYYPRMMNAYLLKISHGLNDNLFRYSQNLVASHALHTKQSFEKPIANKQEVAFAYIEMLGKLRTVLTKTQHKNLQVVAELKDYFLKLAETLTGQGNGQTYFRSLIFAFTTVMRNSLVLPLERTIGKESEAFAMFIKIMQNESDGILGSNLKSIIDDLLTYQSVKSSEALKLFSDLFSKKSGPKVKKIIKVEMTYEQEKKQILKKRPQILEAICHLPSNALKVDLILEQLVLFTKKTSLQKQDYKLINFYIRESSKICQYHNLYYESIVLLMVIPDFNGIELLLDDFVKFLKRKHSYESKKLLNDRENELVGKLLTIAGECLRDNLVKKLINLLSLSDQIALKPALIRKEQAKNMKNYLSNIEAINGYKKRLEQRDIKFFYNLKESAFDSLLNQREQLVKNCQQFQDEKGSKQKYEDREAFRYLLDVVPIPVISR